MTDDHPPASDLEYMSLATIQRIADRCRGDRFVPVIADGECLRDAIAARWADLCPLLLSLSNHLNAARADGRL